MKNTIDVRRLATNREMKIVRDALTIKSETPRKTYFDNFVVISFCALCLTALAAFIQYG
jgi:hypothetical protein